MPPLTDEEILERVERLVVPLADICPKVEDLREVLLFCFAGSLGGLSPEEVAKYFVRATRMLDVSPGHFRRTAVLLQKESPVELELAKALRSYSVEELQAEIDRRSDRGRCAARESGGVQCELPSGHEGDHACPEALKRLSRKWSSSSEPSFRCGSCRDTKKWSNGIDCPVCVGEPKRVTGVPSGLPCNRLVDDAGLELRPCPRCGRAWCCQWGDGFYVRCDCPLPGLLATPTSSLLVEAVRLWNELIVSAMSAEGGGKSGFSSPEPSSSL